jgi:hypothetical protein
MMKMVQSPQGAAAPVNYAELIPLTSVLPIKLTDECPAGMHNSGASAH